MPAEARTFESRLSGFLWGGFEYPKSRSSAVYQLVLGFIVLVVIATYTANLATLMAMKDQSSAYSIDDIILNDKVACVPEGGWIARLSTVYPRLQYELAPDDGTVAPRLSAAGGSCDAIICARNYYDDWRTNPAFCNLIISQVISPEFGGWVANRKSGWCVGAAFDWALNKLSDGGHIARLHTKYFPSVGCSGAEALAEITTLDSTNTTVRRLASSDALESSDALADSGAPGSRRRLKGGGVGGGGNDSGALGMYEMAGIVALWVVATVSILLWSLCFQPLIAWCMHRLESNKVHPKAKPGKLVRAMTRMSTSGELNTDNESSMLRDQKKVLSLMLHQLSNLNEKIDAVNQRIDRVDQRVDR